ncbi:FAR-17a/AIG1-like protein [Paraburkholderia sp. Tr-20389]|uniref:Pr6Pr family membrane protein n=1 Tax=Paraburkholderia sp. Tr-20389 TaxID=2703903 RepID=UPI00197D09A8|nr:Pr6Pr family membrane protein [Paraburkholderia sp. Tr-20389]MBN3759020.1 FAR-17a/AIG1-like protein [Paraburkholderia sp. Tr-20389]
MKKPASLPVASDTSPLAAIGAGLPLRAPGIASVSLAMAIALVAWLGFAAQTDITVHRMLSRGYGVLDGIERLTSYLTNLTIFTCALCFTCVGFFARGGTPIVRFFRQPTVVTAVTCYIVFVGFAYNLLLRHLWTPSGWRMVLNESLHTLVPLLAALYWLWFVPRFHLTLRHLLWWLVYPLGYLALTMARGAASDFYPYPFIDVGELGYERVLINASLLVLAFLLLMAVFAAINHRRPMPSIASASSRPQETDHDNDPA